MTGQAKGEHETAQGAGEVEVAFKPDDDSGAFESMRGEIEALGRAKPLAPRIDVQKAAALAYGVALRDARPERREAFERLAAGGFYDMKMLERLSTLSLATWFARRQQLMYRAIASEAKVPEEVVRDARTLCTRMTRVLEHWLVDRPNIIAKLGSMRERTGYVALTDELTLLADLYERDDIQPVIARDSQHYRPGDSHDAHRLAHTLFEGLGLRAERDEKRWTVLTHGAFRLLANTYDEHRRSGIYAFGRHEDVGRTYPLLATAVRAPAGKGRRGGGGGHAPQAALSGARRESGESSAVAGPG